MADYETTIHGKKQMDLLQALNELRRINRYAPGIEEQRQGITGPSRDWIEQQPLDGYTPEEFQMMQSPTSDMQGVSSMLPTEEQPSQSVMGPGQEYQSDRNILQPQNPEPVSRETPDQAKMLLDNIYKQSDANPEAKKAGELRHLLASVLGGAQAKYDLGGGISAGGDTPSSLQRQKEMYDWAKRPEEQAKAEQEKKRQMLDDLMKYDNLKSQVQSRELTGKMTQAKIDEMNAQNSPGSALNSAEAEKTRAIIGGYQQQLNDFGTDKDGNPTVKGYVSAAKQLQQLSDQAPKMNYKQLQDAQQRADKIVSAATGLAGKDISQQSANNTDAYHRGQLDLMNKRLGQAEERLNFDKGKLHLKTQNVNIPFNDLQKVTTTRDLLENLNSLKSRAQSLQSQLGYEGKAEDFMRDLVNQRTPEMARLMADIENMFAEPRKSRFGSAITAGDDAKMKAFVPDIKNNPGQFFAKLDSIIDTSSRTGASSVGNILRSRRIPYGGDIRPETALDDTNYILDYLTKSGTENQIPARPQPQGGSSSNPATPNDDIIKKAKKALADPNAPRAAKEAAKKILGQ